MPSIAVLFLFTNLLFSQQYTEKAIVSFPQLSNLSSYSFKYDKSAGTYVYIHYDEASQKYAAYSNRGNSRLFSSLIDYRVIMADNGDYYMIADDVVDSVYTYFVLKNGKEVASFDFIDVSWTERDGIIYFACKEKGRWFLAEYTMSTGAIKKGKPYDEIYLVSFDEDVYEGEPVGEVGFTRDGKPYYLAGQYNEKFLVTGDIEQKHYSDIENYSVVEDNSGVLTYFARDKGKFYDEKGSTFLVQGDKELKTFDYLYMPIIFDKNNTPIYVAGDSAANYAYPQRVVIGNEEGKSYSGGISYLQFTPSGTLAYVASILVNPEKSEYKSFLVVDGKEGKAYNYISYLNFLPDGTPLYSASYGFDKSVIITGVKEKKVELPNVVDLRLLPNGLLAYVESAYGNYERKQKDRYVVHIGDEEFGPFDGMQFLYGEQGSFIISDKDGNYLFIASYLKDFKSYLYENVLYTNSNKSKKFDYFENVELYKGKPLYVCSRMTDRKNYIYEYTLFYDSKQIGQIFNTISDFEFDENSGKVSFTGLRGKDFYYVEVKL